ncbi:hypothetical protein GINT2_001628 [Glugoides intestinalis]
MLFFIPLALCAFSRVDDYFIHPGRIAKTYRTAGADIIPEKLDETAAFKAFSSPFIIKRILYTTPELDMARYNRQAGIQGVVGASDSLRDAVRGKIEKETAGNGISLLNAVLFLVLLGISGVAGFYFGKFQESKNYIRVPASN